jgi:hypothetical protein
MPELTNITYTGMEPCAVGSIVEVLVCIFMLLKALYFIFLNLSLNLIYFIFVNAIGQFKWNWIWECTSNSGIPDWKMVGLSGQ